MVELTDSERMTMLGYIVIAFVVGMIVMGIFFVGYMQPQEDVGCVKNVTKTIIDFRYEADYRACVEERDSTKERLSICAIDLFMCESILSQTEVS